MTRRTSADVRKPAGFTLVELVVTMIILAIMAVAIVPRFANRQAFDARGFFDQARAAVEFARKAAIAERRNVCVIIAAGTLTVTRGAAFGDSCGPPAGLPLINPTTGNPFALSAPTGVTLATSSAGFTFDANGSTASAVTITVDGTRVITVEAGTGYVH